jgi:DNA repair protein RadA/Sms
MFSCNACGAGAPRWAGRCPRCGAWGALEESGPARPRARAPPPPRPLAEYAAERLARRSSGFQELDRALGGGFVPGGAVLVGGEPGIGKSTLLLAVCARAGPGALYVAGEESPAQVALRAERLRIDARALLVAETTDTEELADLLAAHRPALCVVDSVQTLRTPGTEGAPGGPAQVRASAEALVPAARATGTALVLVGQVTKEGGLAGPRFLEHAVDAVLLFEGDRHATLRALRPVKNRFGPTDEIGLFEMRADGLAEVADPSRLLLADRLCGPGTAVAAVVEGRRPLCVEVQALLIGDDRSAARRRASGLDPRRLEMLVGAVQEMTRGLGGRDVYVNVVGGLAIRDTGIDLAVAAAVLGLHTGREVDPAAALIGEVGLRGEVKPAPRMDARLKEAKAMGFARAFVPAGTAPVAGIRTTEVATVPEVLEEPARAWSEDETEPDARGPPALTWISSQAHCCSRASRRPRSRRR